MNDNYSLKNFMIEKLIKEIIISKCATRVFDSISIKDIKKYNIPVWALQFDGVNAPESGIFVNSEEQLKAGDLVYAPNYNQYVVITYVLLDDYLATKAISGPFIPIQGINNLQVPTVK